MPLPFRGFTFNFQIELIESCISVNTLVAPISKVIIPIIVEMRESAEVATTRIVSYICKAAGDPTKLLICRYKEPSTASLP